MKTNREYAKNVGNVSVNASHWNTEPKSAHATPVVEKYVKKRREKAEKQAIEEHKTDSLWSSIKYVIL